MDTVRDNDSKVTLLRMVIRPLDGDLLDSEVAALVRDASRLKWVDDSAFTLAGGSAGAFNLQEAEVAHTSIESPRINAHIASTRYTFSPAYSLE